MITEDHYKELDNLMKVALENDDVLTDWENQFISDFVEKLEKYAEKINISDKQQNIFDRIERKLRTEGAI